MSKLRTTSTQNKDQKDSSVVQVEDDCMVSCYNGVEVEDRNARVSFEFIQGQVVNESSKITNPDE